MCEDAPVHQLLFQLFDGLDDRLTTLPDGDDFPHLVIVKDLGHHLGLGDSLPQQKVHRATLLRHKLFEAVTAKDLVL